MHEIVPGVWTWSVHDDDRGIDFNGYYVGGEEAAIVDPPMTGEDDLRAIEGIGRPVAVLLTNKHHTRASRTMQLRFDCPIWAPEADRELIEIPVQRSFRDGDRLPGGLVAVAVPGGKTPGETAFLHAGAVRSLIVGDAVIGKPAGALSMLPDEKFADPGAAREGLRVLLRHDFEALLLGDGAPIPRGGKDALRAFLAAAS